MNDASSTFVGLNLLFAALFVASARAVVGRRPSPILWAFVVVTLFFAYLLPTQEYSTDVGADVLLLSHLLFISYLTIVLLVARRHTVQVDQLVQCVHAVPNRAIAVAIVAWLAVRAYLIAVYGPVAPIISRSLVLEPDRLVVFSTWEVALSSITTFLLMGAFSVTVIRHATGEESQSRVFMLGMLAMLAVILLTKESPIGFRRLLLVLFALWFSVAWMQSGRAVWAWLRRYRIRFAVAATLVVALGFWYQNVRRNDFTEILTAGGPDELLAATVRFATTVSPETAHEEVQYLRSGPFDFFAKVVDVWMVEGRSTAGDASAFSFAMAVPKVLFPGEKPVGDVDDVLSERLYIYPSGGFLNIDYPTSLPAIGVADFGPLGGLATGILLGLAFSMVGFLIKRWGRNPLALLIALGFAVQLMGSQEAGLTAIVSGFRDCVVALLFILPIGWFWRRISGQIRSSRQIKVRATAPVRNGIQSVGGVL